MAVSLTCRVCAARITPPGGRAEAVARCPWCDADLNAPAPVPAHRPPRGRRLAPERAPTEEATPATSGVGHEPVVAVAVLAVSAVMAVGAFFAARHLMLLAG